MKLVPKVVTRKVAMSILRAKKNSPTIFFAGGVVGVIGAAVLASRATLKLEGVLEESGSKLKDLEMPPEEKSLMIKHQQIEHTKDISWVYMSSAYDVAKLYAPAVILGGVSIFALTGAHVTLMRRNAALTAAVGTIATAFGEYRDRVRDAVGEAREYDIYTGVKTVVEIDQDGNKEIIRINPDKAIGSPWARCFDEVSTKWEKYPDYNYNIVRNYEKQFNHRLQAYGFVFLNDVYEALGFERIPEGQLMGWLRDGDGDGFIDFGIDEPRNIEFIKGTERSAWLDFNVDGLIWDKI